MTHGLETDEKTGKAEAQPGCGLNLLWLWPVLVLQAILEAFAGHATRLKTLRKAKPRIAETDWLIHVENLRVSEWMTRTCLAVQAAQLLCGEEIDPADTLAPAVPSGWLGAEPRSLADLTRRFEALARIHAQPMRYVERHARRLEAAALAADPRHAAVLSAMEVERAPCAASGAMPAAPGLTDQRWTLGIPAPP